MNKIILCGRLTQDIQTNESGKIAKSCIAVDRALKDASGNKVTDFINLKWLGEKKAEFAKKYLSKGSKVIVVGEANIDKWKDKDGNDRTAFTVNVAETEFAESKTQAKPVDRPNADGFMNIPDGIEEELPFN